MSNLPHLTRNEHELYQAYLDKGAKAATTPDEAMLLAKLLRDEPAYSDPKHRGHKIVKRDIKQLYDSAIPDQPDADLILGSGSAWR